MNGDIDIEDAEVGGNIESVNGNLYVREGSVVKGDIIIEKPSFWSFGQKSKMPKIMIGPGAVVEGKIMLEREVELYISESAEVGGVEGAMSMDDAIRFSGDKP